MVRYGIFFADGSSHVEIKRASPNHCGEARSSYGLLPVEWELSGQSALVVVIILFAA